MDDNLKMNHIQFDVSFYIYMYMFRTINYLATSYLSYFDNRLDSSSYEDWSTEENLVKSTVDTGNDRLLTNSQITEFIKSCQACNCDKVLELLCQSLQSTDGPLLMVGTSKNEIHRIQEITCFSYLLYFIYRELCFWLSIC